ncbi:hypothetical protein [Halosolutus gelatinilyticus]|uniref:hypothetical protein n=1 Tax=Halosolutus gelatinilyticus TaxID=2931975 RepID=UPI001FF6FB61|nr:hypothetical protein [Halosolutus gelatinilyticus]
MEPFVPLFVPGAPGGPELLILLFSMLLFALPVAGIAVVIWAFTRGRSKGTDVAALEQRVATLERRVEYIEEENRN